MNPLFSIITVCYNSEKTIERTIQSVLNQDFIDYEYIIIDGKSKDRTLEIIERYIPLLSGRMRYYSEPDKGIYDAMNKGIRKAKGEYIWLVNSDDYIESNSLSIIHNVLSQQDNNIPSVISGTMSLVYWKDGNIKIVKTTRSTSKEIKHKARIYEMGIAHPATIVHRGVYDKVGLYDDRYYISADIDFFLRCVNLNIPFLLVNDSLTNMTMEGISNQLPLKKNIHDWNIRYRKFCKSKFEYTYYMLKSIFKLCVRKVVPASYLYKFFYQKKILQ